MASPLVFQQQTTKHVSIAVGPDDSPMRMSGATGAQVKGTLLSFAGAVPPAIASFAKWCETKSVWSEARDSDKWRCAMSATAGPNPDRIAREILELVNSRPTTPRQDEIAAIIARATGAPAPPPADSRGLDEYGPDLTRMRASTGKLTLR